MTLLDSRIKPWLFFVPMFHLICQSLPLFIDSPNATPPNQAFLLPLLFLHAEESLKICSDAWWSVLAVDFPPQWALYEIGWPSSSCPQTTRAKERGPEVGEAHLTSLAPSQSLFISPSFPLPLPPSSSATLQCFNTVQAEQKGFLIDVYCVL